MLPRIVKDHGTISIANGSRIATGTGTSWSTILDRGALIFVGTEARPGIVSSRQVRSTDTDPEDAPAGTFVADAEVYFLEDWAGSTASGEDYVAIVFGGSAELNETLVRVLTELTGLGLVGVSSGEPDPDEGRENEYRIDPETGIGWQRLAGTWTAVTGPVAASQSENDSSIPGDTVADALDALAPTRNLLNLLTVI